MVSSRIPGICCLQAGSEVIEILSVCMSNIPEDFCPCIVSKLHYDCIFIGVDNLPGSEIYLFSCVGGSNYF